MKQAKRQKRRRGRLAVSAEEQRLARPVHLERIWKGSARQDSRGRWWHLKHLN